MRMRQSVLAAVVVVMAGFTPPCQAFTGTGALGRLRSSQLHSARGFSSDGSGLSTRRGPLHMSRGFSEGSKDDGLSKRDDALGMLSAGSFRDSVKGERDALGFRSIESLNRDLERAREAAAEAEERAAKLSRGGKPAKAANNGLSNMMTPIAMQMSQQRTEYLAEMRCPIKELQESLEVTRCGIMRFASTLDPLTVGGGFLVMYALTVMALQ
mmetsp:Transcript_12378/g.28851  ORF Transcript_12378/g.28851 Transcript_12378/m.28851 type:complete len:212 (-) Transcript_12378:250-885(-)